MAADGQNVPTNFEISGTGVTKTGQFSYEVGLSMTKVENALVPVTLTTVVADIDGTDLVYTGDMTWISKNVGVATVDEDGVITPVAIGETTIEVAVPAFCLTGANALINGKIYANVHVKVRV